MLVNTERRSDEITHVYLGEAKNLKDKPSLTIGGET
jgi:chorismate mutase